MGGPLFHTLLEDGWDGQHPPVEVVPGVTAAVSANAVLGAPLADDLALISLSDILTPWTVIAQRLEAVAQADFVLALYNPASTRRRQGFQQAQRILLRHRSPDTLVALVRNALRGDTSLCMTTLAHLPHAEVDMLTLVIVGNSSTARLTSDRLVSHRGLASLASRVARHRRSRVGPQPATRDPRPLDLSSRDSRPATRDPRPLDPPTSRPLAGRA
jgi:precorrin-3B C17-methyltransferase